MGNLVFVRNLHVEDVKVMILVWFQLLLLIWNEILVDYNIRLVRCNN
mgnify:CR=1 FL=1